MKKTSFFFILIFSVFFSYQNVFASNGNPDFPDWNAGTLCPDGSGHPNFFRCQHTAPPYGVALTDANPIFHRSEVGETNYSDPTNGGVTGGNFIFSDASALYGLTYGSCPDGIYLITVFDWYAGKVVAYQNEIIVSGSCTVINGEVLFIPPDTQGTYNESPYNGEVVATSGTGDVLVAFDYYLDTDQDPNHDTAEWCIRLVRNDGPGEAEYCDDVAFDTYTSVSHTFTGLALDSQWDWSIIFTRPGFFIDEYSILHAGSNYFFAGRFTIDSTVEEIYTAYTTCSITDLAGCFQNAIVFLFYPSQSSLNDFSNLYDAIKDKPPFGYISAVQTALQGINDTETGVFTLETMPILDTYIFTPVRTALIWIMWLAFIFMFYHRLKNIHL